MQTMLESVLYAGAGLGDYAWVLPVIFFAILLGGLYAYFTGSKKGFLGKIASVIEEIGSNPYKLVAYLGGTAVFFYILTQIPAIPYISIVTGIATMLLLATSMGAVIVSVFGKA